MKSSLPRRPPCSDLYLMRYLTTTLYTSWMMIVFSLPVFGAFGTSFRGRPALSRHPGADRFQHSRNRHGHRARGHHHPGRTFSRPGEPRISSSICPCCSASFSTWSSACSGRKSLPTRNVFPISSSTCPACRPRRAPLLPPSWASSLLTGYLQDHYYRLASGRAAAPHPGCLLFCR